MHASSPALKLSPLPSLAPPIWAKNGHLQTILGHLLPSRSRSLICGEEVRIPLEDEDQLLGMHVRGESNLVVYLFHGLMSDISAGYVQRIGKILKNEGHSLFLINQRGCGDGNVLAKNFFHSGRSDDLASAIRFGKKIHPEKKHLAVGFSAGGNTLLLLLTQGRAPLEALPDAAISVNAPISLESSSRALERGFSRVYDTYLMQACRYHLKALQKRGVLSKDLRAPLSWTIRQFDEGFTAPQAGFLDRAHYYRDCSSKPHLKKVTVPTVMIASKDDPFIPYHDYETCEFSPQIHCHFEGIGGHLGYLTKDKTPFGTYHWLDYALFHYVKELEKRLS